jgi:predicted dehydrogenase
MIRVGVAGLGWLGESLIKDLPRVSGLELIAVQDVVVERARAVADRYSARFSLERFEDLLAVSDVDAVLICTPNGLHAEQAQAALQAGKDVLVQKPLALSCADAVRTLEVAARAEQPGRFARCGPRSTTSTARARTRRGSSMRAWLAAAR